MAFENLPYIAAKYGWNVSIRRLGYVSQFNFIRKTLSGVPFCLTVETDCEDGGRLVREIISFVDALDPERFAVEWLVKTGICSPRLFRQAVSDMEDIRQWAWLLAYDLGESSGEIQGFLPC